MTALIILAFGPGTALAETISLAPSDHTVTEGSTVTYDIVMDSAPNGLAGYKLEVSLANPGNAEIVAASFPGWASLSNAGSLPADSVQLSGVDLNRQIQNGSAGVVLATITVRGDSAGSTGISINPIEIDADGGDAIGTATRSGQLTIQAIAAPTTTPTVTPTVTPTPAATPTVTPGPAATPTVTATASPTATQPGSSTTATATPRVTPTATATAVQTATPVPTATPQATATATATIAASPEATTTAQTAINLTMMLGILAVVLIAGVAVYFLAFRKR